MTRGSVAVLIVVMIGGCKKEPPAKEEPKPAATEAGSSGGLLGKLFGKDNPSSKVMPTEFEDLQIGAEKSSVLEKDKYQGASKDSLLRAATPWLDDVYVKKVEGDERFKEVALGFKADRLAQVVFAVHGAKCTDEYFHGLKTAMNEKLGCEALMYRAGEYFQGATIGKGGMIANWNCVPKLTPDSDAQDGMVGLSMVDARKKTCWLGLIIRTVAAKRWRPKTDPKVKL